MNIAVLSRSPSIYSTYRILAAGKDRGHKMIPIDHIGCKLSLDKYSPLVYYKGQKVENLDAIIPRIGASVTFYGSAVIQQFEMQGVYTVIGSEPLLRSRNKLRSLQLLSQSGIGMPTTYFTHFNNDMSDLMDRFDGEPIIIKLLEGTQGLGVVLAENPRTAESIVDSFTKLKKRFLLQEFISESKGTDIRAFIVDGQVVASMKRQAPEGEFRSNIHRGGRGIPINLTKAERWSALEATRILKLRVAGVDLLRSNDGPKLLEVNPSPGLEGIEGATGVDIATKIIQMVERHVRSKS